MPDVQIVVAHTEEARPLLRRLELEVDHGTDAAAAPGRGREDVDADDLVLRDELDGPVVRKSMHSW